MPVAVLHQPQTLLYLASLLATMGGSISLGALMLGLGPKCPRLHRRAGLIAGLLLAVGFWTALATIQIG